MSAPCAAKSCVGAGPPLQVCRDNPSSIPWHAGPMHSVGSAVQVRLRYSMSSNACIPEMLMHFQAGEDFMQQAQLCAQRTRKPER